MKYSPTSLAKLRSQMPDDVLIGTLSRQDPEGFGAFAAKQQAKNPDLPPKFIINKFYLGSASGKLQPRTPNEENPNRPTKTIEELAADSQPSIVESWMQDAGNVFGGAINSVLHPIETAKSLGTLAVGVGSQIDKVLPEAIQGPLTKNPAGKNDFLKNAEAGAASVTQDFVGRYGGGPMDVLKGIARQPFSTASDVSSALGLGSVALGKVGTAGQIGQQMAKASNVVDPVLGTAKVAKGITKLGGEALGLTTGAGYAPSAVYKAGKEAPASYSSDTLNAMRGRTGPTTIVDEARVALDMVKQGRAEAYVPRFEAMTQNSTPLDLTPLKSQASEQLSKFGIKITDKGLDFSRSTISDAAEQAKVRAVWETVNDWGSQAGDNLPVGVDLLKRRLADFDSASGQARALISKLHSSTRKLLVDSVPGYETMVKEYEKTSKEINEIQRVLSINDTASADTALRKLTSTVRQNNEYRAALVKHLKEVSGTDLTGMAAGQMMHSIAPQGIMRGFAGGSAALGFVNPMFWLSLPATSPRLVGEFLYAIGYSHGQVSNVLKLIQGKANLPAGLAAPARQTLTLPDRSNQ